MKSSASHVGSPLTHRPIAMAVVTLAGTYLALAALTGIAAYTRASEARADSSEL
jgi:hypothetical protein